MQTDAPRVKTIEPDLDSSGGGPLTWLIFTVVMIALFGLVYPVVTTLIGQALFPVQATGSLITRNGAVVGSSLIGQSFSGAKYFVGRPSAAGNGYDPTSASGSNAAPSNLALVERATATAKGIAAREGVPETQIPVDLIAASGSGLDPHISPAAAELQAARVARTRGLTVDAVRAAIARHTEQPTLGVLGQARVNVLELNLDLDGTR
jgi:potassium-transporting ATPase KdpC subunit